MNEKDIQVIKILSEMGMLEGEKLTKEEEQLFERALDPELDYDMKTMELMGKK